MTTRTKRMLHAAQKDMVRLAKLNESLPMIPKYETTKGAELNDMNVELLRRVLDIDNQDLTLQENTDEDYLKKIEECTFTELKNVPYQMESDSELFQDSGSEYVPSSVNSDDTSSNDKDDLENEGKESPIIPVQPSIRYDAVTDVETELPTSSKSQNGKLKVDKSQRMRRKHTCPFCDQQVGNFSRHLERNHDDELGVQEFMVLNKNSKKRKKLIDKLRREGDFGTSDVVPVQQMPDKHKDEYIPCLFCKCYYARKSLRRHSKTCHFNPDPTKQRYIQAEGQTLMSGHLGPNDILKTSGLFNMLRADAVALVIKRDGIICEVGRRYLRSHREKHLNLVAKRKMRRLARLLMAVRKIVNDDTLTLADILTPTKFKVIIEATKSISGYDDVGRNFKSPSLALQMGTLIKSAINAAYSADIQKANVKKSYLDGLKMLTTLIETDWAMEISSDASQNLAIHKFNKPSLIPVAEDIVKFEKYLKRLIANCITQLVQESSQNVKIYRELQEAIFCSVLIFNKRRVGELQRIMLSSFMEHYNADKSSEFEKLLSESEKILYKSLRRLVIRGKRGRGVPVLFERKIVEAIEFSITQRSKYNLTDNPYLFGLPGLKSALGGYLAMRKHAKLALGETGKASLLTSTRLRKHLATIVQILNMDKTELEQLATFMGHTEKTHSQFYRLPDDIYQTAKVGKILLLAKNGSIEQFKGKSLSDLQIDPELEGNESENEDTAEPNSTDVILHDTTSNCTPDSPAELRSEDDEPPVKIKRGLKRNLVPWTTEQKRLVELHFKTHIKKKQPPKKLEVQSLTDKHPKVFANKTWPQIKVYVQNKYRST